MNRMTLVEDLRSKLVEGPAITIFADPPVTLFRQTCDKEEIKRVILHL